MRIKITCERCGKKEMRAAQGGKTKYCLACKKIVSRENDRRCVERKRAAAAEQAKVAA